MKVFALGVGGFSLDQSSHGKNHKEESEIVRTTVVFARNRFLFIVDDGEHVIFELELSDAVKDPRDLLEIGVCQGDGTVPGGKMGLDKMFDVSWLTHGSEGEGLGKEGEFREEGVGIGREGS